MDPGRYIQQKDTCVHAAVRPNDLYVVFVDGANPIGLLNDPESHDASLLMARTRTSDRARGAVNSSSKNADSWQTAIASSSSDGAKSSFQILIMETRKRFA